MGRPDRIAWFAVMSFLCGLAWWLIGVGSYLWDGYFVDHSQTKAGMETGFVVAFGGTAGAGCAFIFWLFSFVHQERPARFWYLSWVGLFMGWTYIQLLFTLMFF